MTPSDASDASDASEFELAYRNSMEGLNSGKGVSPIRLMNAMLGHENVSLANDLFCVNLWTQTYEQQDASEALICIMQIFEQSKIYKSFISSLFGFDLGKIIKCGICGAKRPQVDSGQSQVLPIQIPENSNHRSKFKFQTLLSNYFNVPEQVAEVECYTCGKNRPVTVQPQLFTNPDIFIFTLNRFKTEVKTVSTGRASLRTKNSQEGQGAHKELSIDKLECFIGLLYSFI